MSVQFSTGTTNNKVVYYQPPLVVSTSSPKPNDAPVFAQSSSGYFVDVNDISSDSSHTSLHGKHALFIWLKQTYLIPPWLYFWISISIFFLFIWIGFVTVFCLLFNGPYLLELSAVELVAEVLKHHSSSYKV